MTRNPDILFLSEYIKNVLYFATVRQWKVLKSTPNTHYFCIDNELVYENYYSDFGPLNLGCVYKYCKILNDKLKQHLNKQIIIHYTSIEPSKKANAAFLLGCYGVLYLSLTPRDALKPLVIHGQSYKPFQDAIQGDSSYTISLLDCLQAIKKARELDFFNFQDFNYEEYDRLDKIQGGDLNWIVPGKFLAFIGPVDNSISLYHPPEMYIDYFLNNNVQIVIRLNKRLYEGKIFSNSGITHYDLFFPDGSCPPHHILLKFLQISEDADGAIAVHCKAGLGRTGSLIGCYLIKHYRMTSHEAIGWMRICRPGSVIGHQQGWLEQLETWLIKQGNLYRKRTYQDTERLPPHEFGVYSIAEKTYKYRPVVFHKSPSPPPLVHRQTRSEFVSNRPQASKVRDASNKAPEKDPSDWRLRTPKLNCQKIQLRGNQTATGAISGRGSSGAGEPRIRSQSRSGASRSQVQHNSTKPNDPNSRYSSGYQPLPTFRTTHGPVIKTINDARNILLRTSLYNEQREKHLNSSTVAPRYTSRVSNRTENVATQNLSQMTPSSFCTEKLTSFQLMFPFLEFFIEESVKSHLVGRYYGALYWIQQDKLQFYFMAVPRGLTQPQQRRRLGRSPSPPQIRCEQSRATNTPPVAEKLAKNTSKMILSELSKLKLSAPREGSFGAASVGAASLGARREAPAPRRAPSVRSDERPFATQGDMLNSIKFQRRLRDTLQTKKLNTLYNERFGMPAKDKTFVKNVNSRTSTGTRQGLNQEFSTPREKVSSASRGFFSPPRPSSPKGRRNLQSNLH
ncbi:uncharacterized protein ACR2FA_004572 [Aphomia sociella]